ncbi:MAG: SDR family NAD(P)-dependent oxidoreductase, partial [Actinobacteria bacterium]|nr:SDR family NAD(P)-dependent oxidoreductase [Actinomycetota bacterium]
MKRGLEINAPASCANLTKPLAVKQLILEVIQTLGSLDGVVNNAGMTSVLDTSEGEFASIDDTTIEKWQKS